MVLLEFSAADFLGLGLELAEFDEWWQHRKNDKTNLAGFRASFYASPKTWANIFADLQRMEMTTMVTAISSRISLGVSQDLFFYVLQYIN